MQGGSETRHSQFQGNWWRTNSEKRVSFFFETIETIRWCETSDSYH